MNEKAFRWGMRMVMLFGLAGLMSVIFLFSPYIEQNTEQKNFLHISFFYVAGAFFLMSFFSLLLYRLRKKVLSGREEVNMGVSFRQGILLAIIVIVILILQSFRVLTWWDGLLTVGAVMMIEMYFLAR